MTVKYVYEAVAIELSKIQAPTIKLYEFNYFINQAIMQFVNKIYNIYDINQQTTDDLRVLKSTATLAPVSLIQTGNPAVDYLRQGTYYIQMPKDYLHLLNCICLFTGNQNENCENKDNIKAVGATKLTSDNWSSVIEDVYNKPSIKKPYYFIHNENVILTASNGVITNTNQILPGNLETDELHDVVIVSKGDSITTQVNSGFNRTFPFDENKDNLNSIELSSIEKPAGSRYANASNITIEIRCGRSKAFELSAVQIDYLKAPQYIKLTQEELDSDLDISQVMEFPDYVNQEIINQLVTLIMRKTNDPSIGTHKQITETIARPAGQQQ